MRCAEGICEQTKHWNYVCRRKREASRKTQSEIGKSSLTTKNIERLKYVSRVTAKVDSALVQDGFNLYHHIIAFTEKGKWAVVQQGMNENYARRYHWLGDNVKEFIEEPHSAICCDRKQERALDMTARKSRENKETCVDLVKDNPKHLRRYFKRPEQLNLDYFSEKTEELSFSPRHMIKDMNRRNIRLLQKAYEIQPKNYEELLMIKGVGAKTIRSLALISSLMYGRRASWKDPVKYSFAHGGKDGIPYSVNRKLMEDNIELLRNAVNEAKLGNKDKINAIRRLSQITNL